MNLPEMDQKLYVMLKTDIERRGILVPVIVTEDDEIIDGKIRMKIAKELGLKNIATIVVGKLDRASREQLRIILNTFRRHLNREQIREVIAWELKKTPDHSDRAIAGRVGVSHKTVGSVRQSTGQKDQSPRKGLDGRYRRPVTVCSNDNSTQEAKRLLKTLGDRVPDGPTTIRKMRTIKNEIQREQAFQQAKPVSLKDFTFLHSDFRKVNIPDSSVDLIITDPPWAEAKKLGKSLGETMKRILKPKGIACVYSNVFHADAWLDAIRSTGLNHAWTVIGLQANWKGYICESMKIKYLYTPILVFSKGPFRAFSTLHDVIEPQGREKDSHEWQQPVGESVHLIRSLSLPGHTICDLCFCTGTVAVATALCGERRKFVGSEINRKMVPIAQARVAEVLGSRRTG